MLRVAGVGSFLDFGDEAGEREGLLRELLEIVFVEGELCDQSIKDEEPWDLVLERSREVLVDIGRVLEKEIDKEGAIVLI